MRITRNYSWGKSTQVFNKLNDKEDIEMLKNTLVIFKPYDKQIMTRKQIESIIPMYSNQVKTRWGWENQDQKRVSINTLRKYNCLPIDHEEEFEFESNSREMQYQVRLYDTDNKLVREEFYDYNYYGRNEEVENIKKTAKFFIPNAKLDIQVVNKPKKVKAKRYYYRIDCDLIEKEINRRLQENKDIYIERIEILQARQEELIAEMEK
jgi:hypothetical protein